MRNQLILACALCFLPVLLFGQKMTVKDSDSHVLMEVNDEGTVGSITVSPGSAAPSTTTNKLYNVSGSLYWNGSALGTAGSAGGWTDGGTSVYTTTSTDKVGIGTSGPEFKLTLEDDGGILAKGTLGSGATLSTSGEGARLIWYPRKAAFRAGSVSTSEWADANIGDHSTAMGYNTKASGSTSTAMGYTTTASGSFCTAMGLFTEASNNQSTAMGEYTTASGSASTAMGSGTTASGVNSTAMGGSTTASGNSATAMGYLTTSSSFASLSTGQYNVGGGTAHSWVSTDPIFEIGIGSTDLSRANAMTVLKNGKVGIGVASPGQLLEVNGKTLTSQLQVGTSATAGHVLTADASGNATWQSAGNSSGWTDGGTSVTTTTSTDKVGIGTSPLNLLDVSGAGTDEGGVSGFNEVTARFKNSGSGHSAISIDAADGYDPAQYFASAGEAMWSLRSDDSDADKFQIRYHGGTGQNTTMMTVENNGDVGVNTASPSRKFFVNGDAGGTGAWNNDSDIRMKKNIETIPGALEKVLKLRGVNFEWTDAENHEPGTRMGFIAQEAEGVIPEVVSVRNDRYAMQYGPITALLVEAVKELQKEVEALKAERNQ